MSAKLPGIGARIIKSAAAIFICYMVNYFRGSSGIVFYSQLSALWCIQSYISTTKKNAVQRIIGTVIGAVFGLAVLLLLNLIKTWIPCTSFAFRLTEAVIISASILPLIWVTVAIKKKQASYFSCVVFLSIVVIHFSDQNSYLFVLNRFLDTVIGIAVGVMVNLFHLPRKPRRDILFVSGLDDTLLNNHYHINDYCKVELNRMLDEGLNFTLSTMRPPASIMEPMSEIRLRLPVIAMDGAVLYDTSSKSYLKKTELEKNCSDKIISLLDENSITYFANVVIDDTLLIYYRNTDCQVQEELIEQLRTSPYRNYIKRPVPETERIVYFMLIYPDEKIEQIHDLLKKQDYFGRLKVLKYKSNDYPGSSYIKIYHRDATKQNMIRELTKNFACSQVISFGTVPDLYDYVVEPGNTNQVVHKIKELYEGQLK